MGIEVVIDKTKGKNIDDSLIVNQIISSGILQKSKYEIHFEDDIDINKKYAIINNENGEQEAFIEKTKGLLSQYIGIPKDDIFIGNIREGFLVYDVIFKKNHKVDVREKMKELANLKKIKSIYEKNILGTCKLAKDMIDMRGKRNPEDWPTHQQNIGGFTYYPPTHNWVGYGLKVLGQYDNGNDDWFIMDGNVNEWAVAYHGTKTKAVKQICEVNGKFFSKFKEDDRRQKYYDIINVNKRSQKEHYTCGEGTYVSPFLDYYLPYKEDLIIMCRVNPRKIRIPQANKYYVGITDGTRNTIRPYRLLFKLNN